MEGYKVEKIIEKKWDQKNGKFLYKIKWCDYSEDECTWEGSDDIDPILIGKFENKDKNLSVIQTKIVKEKEPKKKSSQLIKGQINVDIPKKVLGLKRVNDKLYWLVEWKENNKIKKVNSIVKNDILRQNYHQILLDFYEERLKFT